MPNPFATVQDVKDQATIPEVTSLDDPKIEQYIDRAYGYLRRYTGRQWTELEYIHEDVVADLNRALILLVEYLWYLDQPAVKESEMAGLESERIGTYSYNKGDKGGITGNEELDQILVSLRGEVGFNLFSVNGPSDSRKRVPYNPHAYVTGYWRKDK